MSKTDWIAHISDGASSFVVRESLSVTNHVRTHSPASLQYDGHFEVGQVWSGTQNTAVFRLSTTRKRCGGVPMLTCAMYWPSS